MESLAACRSRAREDALKQQLMAEVLDWPECSNSVGRFSFLEMKNLNAFLLRVVPMAARELGNRCDELIRARKCLEAMHVGERS